jgi:hypothetical protein
MRPADKLLKRSLAMNADELIAMIRDATPDGALLEKLEETKVVSWEELAAIHEALKSCRPGMYIRINRQVQRTWRDITQQLTS